MSDSPPPLGPASTLREVLAAYPGAQRALFRRYHIGGCSSCGFQPDETLQALCQRNGQLPVDEVLAHIQASHQQDARLLLHPAEAAQLLARDRDAVLLDVRSREEFEAASIPGAILLTQDVMNDMLSRWPRSRPIVIADHQGRQALDAAAYFLGHGFDRVHALRGGLDAWSQEVDPSLPRYRLAPAP